MIGWWLVTRIVAAAPLVGVPGVIASPQASTALEEVDAGLVDMLRLVVRARGWPVAERMDTLFPTDEAVQAVMIGGYVRRASCDDGPGRCTVKVRWEVYDVRARMVVLSATTTGDAVHRDPKVGVQQAVAQSLDRVLAIDAFTAALPRSDGLPAPAWSTPLPVPTCTASPLTLPRDVERVLDPVVILRAPDGTGSGVVISGDGHVATAAHVVGDHDHVEAILRNGLVVEAEVVRLDQAFDVAILDLPGEDWPCRPLRTSPPALGTDLYVVGAPFGPLLGWSVARGVFGATRTFGELTVLQTDASINRGNSGGPMFDSTGAAVALVSFKHVGASAEGLGFGVPAGVWGERLAVGIGAPPAATSDEPRRAWSRVDLPAIVDPASPPSDSAPPTEEE